MSHTQNINVFVRCRPLTDQEKRLVLEVIPERNEVKVLNRCSGTGSSYDSRSFFFDQVFSPEARQEDVYRTVVRPLIDQVLLGFNCTVFAYGQTGTGKTYTMEGRRSDEHLSWEKDPHCGIIPRAISQLFDTLQDQDNEFTVRVSFLELYNEDAYDLLSPIDDASKLKIFDDSHKKGSVIVGGLEEIIVQSKAEIFDILRRGSEKRQTAATLLNACSSRSHTIFSVTVHIREGSIQGEELLKIGKLNLVDLAGSENIGRSGAQDKRAREAGNINQSLLTLGRVITALVEKRPHVPYRESKLTRLLQDSLGGKTKTSLIATVSPAPLDAEDTLSTLDYASRAKKITNKPEMNQRLTKKALLREYTQEIERLRRDLQAAREKNGIYIDEENYKEMCKKLSTGDVMIQEKEDRLTALQRDLESKTKLFEDFTSQYEKTKQELDAAREHCERQKRYISERREKEKRLVAQTSDLLKVAENAASDNYLLHNKTERIGNTLKENRASIDRYYPRFMDDMTRLESLIELYGKELVTVSVAIPDQMMSGVDSCREAIDRFSASNSILIENLSKQAEHHLSLVKNLEEQSTSLTKQAEQYESLAKQCRKQKDEISSQVKSHIRLSEDLKRQADTLAEQGDPISRLMIKSIDDVKVSAEKSIERVEQVNSTMNSTVRREFGSLRQELDGFLREFKEDVKTGLTPQKRAWEIPKWLPHETTCDSILEDSEDDSPIENGDCPSEVV